MDSTDEKRSKNEAQPGPDLEERRKVVEEYIVDLRAFLDKFGRKLD